MNHDENKPFLQRIKDSLPEMHPAERCLADFLLSFPGELASYNASELSQLASVSNATVSRFVQRLGYKNYDEARRHVRSGQKARSALVRVAAPSDTPAQILDEHLQEARANIEQSFHAITLPEVDSAAQAILTSRRVWIIGFRISQPFAAYLYWQLMPLLDNSALIPQAWQTMAEHIASMKKDDTVIVFGLRRQIRSFPKMLAQICLTDAKTVLITDDDSERVQQMTWHFRCRTASGSSQYNHVAVMALAHLLTTRVQELAGPNRRNRLSMIESLYEKLEEF